MTEAVLALLGGLGLFLLGMSIMTAGLKALAGTSLRRFLARSTNSPTSGALAGALSTAVIQSSSATTLTAIGFVSASLLTFEQSLGIIFGANIGTTVTGWMVALLGFKLDLGAFVLPLLFVAVLFHLFGHGKALKLAWPVIGFCLLFIGISAIQSGMEPFGDLVTPDSFPDDTLSGRLMLVFMGAALTLITQSSSAGVATALAALYSGAISFPQAAALVIGMDVGTTFTAAIATLGSARSAKQTGFAHVFYNVVTAFMAFLLLAPLGWLAGDWAAQSTWNAQIGLVAFHSTFNALGVVLILPFTRPFARLILAVIPENQPELERGLDQHLLRDPEAASAALRSTLLEIHKACLETLQALLNEKSSSPMKSREIGPALSACRRYQEEIIIRWPKEGNGVEETIHLLDHLFRLDNRLKQIQRVEVLARNKELARLAKLLELECGRSLSGQSPPHSSERFDRLRQIFRDQRRTLRQRFIVESKKADETLLLMDSLRWLHRVSYHLWRLALHAERQAKP